MLDITPDAALAIIKPLALFILGMVIYSLFIFNFYRFLASRDIFELDLVRYNESKFGGFKKFVRLIMHIVKNVIIFPICVFFWFLILAVLLAFLAKSQTIENVLLVAMAVVGAVRVTAYYNEDLSKDLAKMLPFALLGVFLIDVSFFSMDSSWALITQLPNFWNTLVVYLLFIIALELVLTVVHAVATWNTDRAKE